MDYFAVAMLYGRISDVYYHLKDHIDKKRHWTKESYKIGVVTQERIVELESLWLLMKDIEQMKVLAELKYQVGPSYGETVSATEIPG